MDRMPKNLIIRRAIGTVGLLLVFSAIALNIGEVFAWWSVIIQVLGFFIGAVGCYWVVRDFMGGKRF